MAGGGIEQHLGRAGKFFVALPEDHAQRNARQGLKGKSGVAQRLAIAAQAEGGALETEPVIPEGLRQLFTGVAVEGLVVETPVGQVGEGDPLSAERETIGDGEIIKQERQLHRREGLLRRASGGRSSWGKRPPPGGARGGAGNNRRFRRGLPNRRRCCAPGGAGRRRLSPGAALRCGWRCGQRRPGWRNRIFSWLIN